MPKSFQSWLDEDAPANAAGLGGVASIGVPAGSHFGEPGVDNRPLKKKKKLVSPVLPPLEEHVWLTEYVGDWKENGFLHNKCSVCGDEVSEHPDSGQQSLAYCGDCGRPTCANCRDESSAQRCKTCTSKKTQARRNLQLPKVKGLKEVTDRYVDLMKQGIWKKPSTRKGLDKPPVWCPKCDTNHVPNKHVKKLQEDTDIFGSPKMEYEPTGPKVMLPKGTRVWKVGNYPVKGELITLDKPTRVKCYAGTYSSESGMNHRGATKDFNIQFKMPSVMRTEAAVSDVDHEDVERAAKAVHDRWMAHQKTLGHTEHKSPDGKEDYMVPYEDLSKPAKDLDRVAVKAVLSALKETAGDANRDYKTADRSARKNLQKHAARMAELIKGGMSREQASKQAYDELKAKKLKEERDTFAGAPVFEVDMGAIMATKNPKNRYHRYSRYVGTDEVGEAIRKHGRKQRGGEMVLKDRASAVMTYLRRKVGSPGTELEFAL